MHFIFNIIIYVSFSQFLNDNFDYDELTALEQLSAYGLKNFMFDVAKVSERGVGKLIKNSHLQNAFYIQFPPRPSIDLGFMVT